MISLPSKFQIGERVKVSVIQAMPIFGFVRSVRFTSSKVNYSIWIREAETTIHDIASDFIEEVPESDRERIEFQE